MAGLREQESDEVCRIVGVDVVVAVTGRAISPAIGDSLALLGRDRTLARVRQCLTRR